jgi:3-hydroxyisobutyrate dehydrogenase
MARIAFIGLGNMGSGMCANLAKAGHQVRAFDLDAAAVARAAEAGAKPAATVADAAEAAEAVVTMLPAGQHVRKVLLESGGVASAAPKGALFIDCSTIAVDDARAISTDAKAAGYAMVDAPVSGGTAAASAGALTFMVGGEAEAFACARPILEAMGKKVFHAGGAGAGQAAKIANNMLLAISMIGTCEAFNLARKLGLDAQTFFDISSNASGQCWSMTSYCPEPGPVPNAPSNRGYQPGFAVGMMLKDLKLAAAAAGYAGAETPLGQHAHDIYAALADAGHAGLDFSAVMLKLKGEL